MTKNRQVYEKNYLKQGKFNSSKRLSPNSYQKINFKLKWGGGKSVKYINYDYYI